MSSDMERKILDRILFAKTNMGISDAYICETLHIQRNSLTEWKSDKSKTYMKFLSGLAELFQLPIEYFYGEIDVLFSAEGRKLIIKNPQVAVGNPTFYDANLNTIMLSDEEIELERLRVNQALTKRIEEITRKIVKEELNKDSDH